MPINWRVNDPGARVEIIFSNPYTVEESERVMRQIYADPRVSRPLRLLVDVRESAAPDTDFVGNAISFWQLHVRDMWGAKIAIVAATDAQIDMAEISERSAEWRELPFSLHVFRDTAEAERWLSS